LRQKTLENRFDGSLRQKALGAVDYDEGSDFRLLVDELVIFNRRPRFVRNWGDVPNRGPFPRRADG
jgi:hypothetical protein